MDSQQENQSPTKAGSAQQFACSSYSPPQPRRTVKMTAVGAALYTPPPVISESHTPPTGGVTGTDPPQIDVMKVLQNANEESSLDLQGELVDQAVENILTLPQVVQEVFSHQQEQVDELQKQKNILKQVQKKLAEAKQDLRDLEMDGTSEQRKIFLAEEENLQMERQCSKITSEIEVLISNTERTKNVIEDKKRELSEQEKMFKDYREKIKEHLEKVEEWQKDKPKYKELKREEEKLNRLKAEKSALKGDEDTRKRLLNGETLNRLKQDLEEKQERNKELKNLIDSKKKEMKLQREKYKKTRQEIEILHKRNAAHVMRLQRQLKEKQARNAMWKKQTMEIEQNIAALRAQLERDTENNMETGSTAMSGSGSQGNQEDTGLGTSQGYQGNAGSGLSTSQSYPVNTGSGLSTSQGYPVNTGSGLSTSHGYPVNTGSGLGMPGYLVDPAIMLGHQTNSKSGSNQ